MKYFYWILIGDNTVMASILKVNTIQDATNSNTAMTLIAVVEQQLLKYHMYLQV